MKRFKAIVAAAALFPAVAAAAAAAESTAAAANPAFSASILGVALNVADLEKSLRFYRDALGMSVLGEFPLPEGKEVFMTFDGKPGVMLILVSGPAAGKAAAAHPTSFGRVVVRASDIATIQSRLKAVGYPAGEVHALPQQQREVLIVSDPDGFKLEFVANTGR